MHSWLISCGSGKKMENRRPVWKDSFGKALLVQERFVDGSSQVFDLYWEAFRTAMTAQDYLGMTTSILGLNLPSSLF